MVPRPELGLSRPRAVFLSDSHLGIKLARGEELLSFLQNVEPEQLYLVGDFFDAWVLTSRWYWPPEYTQIVARVLELAERGTRVRVIPGNHDSFLRSPLLPQVSTIEIADEFWHHTADGRRFVVTHGDLFDGIEKGFRWLSKVGSFGYTLVIDANLATNWLLTRFGLRPRYFAFWIKRTSKRLLGAHTRFRRKLLQHARDRQAAGIICGHVHLPQILDEDGTVYINTGDWLENASAVIESHAGDLRLVNLGHEIARSAARSSRDVSAVESP